ncbi:MAG: HAD family phosphatase [Myxococcota bacterium]
MNSFPQAWVFDLDGTLVQTETLKADSYHSTLTRIVSSVSRTAAHEHYSTVVGRSGEEVARSFVDRFTSPEAIHAVLDAEPDEPAWATFYRLRKAEYARLLDDPDSLRLVACPYNRRLLEQIRNQGGRTALATMSHRPQVARVLDVLDLKESFEFVATRDDVEHGKPDPEIYRFVFDGLGVDATQAAIIEDSPSGAKAALASGARVVVVVNDITRDAIAKVAWPDDRSVVLESDEGLEPAVMQWIRAGR